MMEFSGNLQFADEGSWLTLTTDSNGTVKIALRISSPGAAAGELGFTVSPCSSLVRIPAGEILRSMTGNGGAMVSGSFIATQGDASCSLAFSVFPCRKFTYKSIEATIFTTRPAKSPVFPGTEDRLYFFSTSGTVTAHALFRLRSGAMSGPYLLNPSYSSSKRCYDLDTSCDTMLSTASSNGLDTSSVSSYDIWIECGGERSETYTFEIKSWSLPLRTYKFLGARGTYEYIHATGALGRSIESETNVFTTSGVEQELENDSTHTFEQNSGHIVGARTADYWLQFLASRQRYIIEKDGSERLIIVDEHKTSLSDLKVGDVTFKWHYANPSNTVIDKIDIALAGLTVTGPSVVNGTGNAAKFGVTYSPSDTTQRGVRWSITSGSEYASIDEYSGTMTVKSGASASSVRVRATSTANAAIYAEKSVTATYTSSVRRYTLTVECPTSGATVAVQNAGSTSATAYTSPMTLEENTTVKIWAYKDGMISSDIQTVTMTSDKTVTVACKAYPKWNLGTNVSVGNTGGAITPTVSDTDSAGWKLGTSSSWIKVNDSGTGFVVDENTGADGRTGGVTLICSANSQVVASCTVSQAATTSEQAPSIVFETGKKEVAATATEATILFSVKNLTDVTARMDGTLENASVSLNLTSRCITVRFDANTSESVRAAFVYVSGTRTDGRGTYTNSFSIIQAAVKADDGLPDGYTAIEYVATRGTKGETIGETGYIDTGIVDSTDLTYFVDFAAYPSSISGLTKSTISFQMGSCGDRSTGSNVTQIFTVNFPAGSGNYGTSGYSEEVSGAWAGDRFGGNKTVLFGTLAQGERHTLEWNSVKGEVIVDGDDSVGEFFNAPSGAESTDCTCYLFAVNFAGEPVDRTSGEVPSTRSWLKLYRFTVKDYDGNVICDMRPCVHDGKAGLYDTIRGSFFSSANNIELVRSDTDLNQ